jgi:hypothetical protein
MSTTSRFSTHHVPDDGTWYTQGEIVRVDRSSAQVQIIKDPDGEYEVHSCRQATEYTGGTPLLRVGLTRGNPEPTRLPAAHPSYEDLGRQVRWGDRR